MMHLRHAASAVADQPDREAGGVAHHVGGGPRLCRRGRGGPPSASASASPSASTSFLPLTSSSSSTSPPTTWTSPTRILLQEPMTRGRRLLLLARLPHGGRHAGTAGRLLVHVERNRLYSNAYHEHFDTNCFLRSNRTYRLGYEDVSISFRLGNVDPDEYYRRGSVHRLHAHLPIGAEPNYPSASVEGLPIDIRYSWHGRSMATEEVLSGWDGTPSPTGRRTRAQVPATELATSSPVRSSPAVFLSTGKGGPLTEGGGFKPGTRVVPHWMGSPSTATAIT